MILALFTVKRFIVVDNRSYTYGGFGKSTISYLDYCDKLIVYGHVEFKDKIPNGWYVFEHPNMEIRSLLPSKNLIYQNLGFIVDYFRIIKNKPDFDIAECRVPDFSGVVGALYCKKYSIPYYVQIVADWRIEGQKTPITKKYGLGLLLKIFYFLYEYFEKKICIDALVFAQGKSSFERYKNLARNCLEYASTTIEIKDIGIAKRLNNNEVKILHVARLTGVKNQLFIINFAKYMIDNNINNFTIDIVGDGPLENELRTKARSLNLEKYIKFLGRIEPGIQLDNVYLNADLFILSSHSEGTPKVLVEAMSKGLPILTSNVGGVSTLVSEKEGYLYTADRLDDCLVGYKKCIQNYENLSKNAILKASNFTFENLNKIKFDIIKEIL